MAGYSVELLMALQSLTGMDVLPHKCICDSVFFLHYIDYVFVGFSVGDLMDNPVDDVDKAVNKLKLKYRTYIVEYNVEEVGSRSILLRNLLLLLLCLWTYYYCWFIVGCCDVTSYVC
jgi:hypothetical protein